MISPRTMDIGGTMAREQTLKEYVEILDDKHCARQQWVELTNSYNAHVAMLDEAEKDLAGCKKSLKDLAAILKAKDIEIKRLKTTISKLKPNDENSNSGIGGPPPPGKAQKIRKAKSGDPGDAGHTL